MVLRRVIPVLLLSNGGLVKTTKFKNPKYVGDPINAIRIFNDKEVDELMVLDIRASAGNREPDFNLVEQFAGECFMPLAYGGGIQTVSQADRLFSLGVEKICVQSSALKAPEFITELASQFGSQSVIASVDIKKDWLGRYRLNDTLNRKLAPESWSAQIQKYVDAGAGEVLLNSVDKDGTLSGPDLDLIQRAAQCTTVPLVSVGGIASHSDIKSCIGAGADAVAAGAFFVYHGPHRAVLITYPKYEEIEKLLS